MCLGAFFFFREGYAIRYNAQFGLREILSGRLGLVKSGDGDKGSKRSCDTADSSSLRSRTGYKRQKKHYIHRSSSPAADGVLLQFTSFFFGEGVFSSRVKVELTDVDKQIRWIATVF